MSISALSTNLQPYLNTNLQQPTNLQNNLQSFQQEFQQLGSDLQSGNLSGAQTELSSLQQLAPGLTSTSNPSNPIAQSFNQLAQQLQSGNVSGAEQDYSSLQQDFQKLGSEFHHHHEPNGSPSMPVSSTLIQDMQSNTLQQAYGALQTNLTQPFGASGAGSNLAQIATSGLSLMV
jgi:hypothetical protein